MGRKVIVEADGGSRGNPGPAGYGALVRDAESGALLAERAESIGRATNNVAEYQGLIAGLRAAAELGASDVDVRMDSKLVVEQMSGRWQVKHESLKPLAREAGGLVRRLGSVRFEWIPRARNSHADRLANEAMDAQAQGRPVRIRHAGDADGPADAEPERTARPREPRSPSWTGATGTPTRLLLLRHGQTPLSVQRRYSGRHDVALTDLGRSQARAAADRLARGEAAAGVVAVVSSPLSRATGTAGPVAQALGLPVDVHEGLIETDFGEWEGMTFADAAARDPELHRRWLADPSLPAPGGESFDAVHRRVRKARDELIARYGGATVVVVSHVTPVKSLLRMALDAGPSVLFRLHLDLASLSIAEFYPDGPASVRLVNDTGHLRGIPTG
jgi:probable phosphoglycerate mutase